MSDWDLGEAYSKSIAVVKKNKVLWIFGAFVAGPAIFNFQNAFSGDSDSTKSPLSSPLPSTTPGLDGETINTATINPLTDIFTQSLSQISPLTYLFLVLVVLGFIALIITISLITRAWGASALIQGVQLGLKGKPVSIAESSKLAFPAISRMVVFQILSTLLSLGVVILLALTLTLLIAGLTLGNMFITILFALLIALEVVAILGAVLFYAIALAFGERSIILGGESAKTGLISGLKIAKAKFWKALGLGIVNNLVGAAIFFALGLILLIGFAGPVVGGMFSFEDNPSLATVLFTIGGIVLMAFILASTVATGIFNAFKASTWNVAYNSLKGDKNDK